MDESGEIETFNKFFVGSSGDKLRIMNLPGLAAGLSHEDALNLAAYLVSMADMSQGHERFNAVLAAVENA